MFILITLQQVPTVDNESDCEAKMHVSGSDTESKGENEQQEEPSLDYYAWSNQVKKIVTGPRTLNLMRVTVVMK